MVIWKGINFSDKGIIVEKTPIIPKGQKKINVYTIEGRNGFLSVDTGNYDSFVVSVGCHLKDNAETLDKVKEFLDGYGTLSFDGKREYTAIIQNSISFEKVLMFKKFIVQFLVNPVAEDIIPTTYVVESENSILNIENSTAKIYPILEITGKGDVSVTINNQTFKLLGINGKYILDSKLKVITHNDINASNKMQYDFPTLRKGENTISYIGNVSTFKIIYRKAYL